MNPTVTSTNQNSDGTWQNTLSDGRNIRSANPQSIYEISASNVNPASQYTSPSTDKLINNSVMQSTIAQTKQDLQTSQKAAAVTNPASNNAPGAVYAPDVKDAKGNTVSTSSQPIGYRDANGKLTYVAGYDPATGSFGGDQGKQEVALEGTLYKGPDGTTDVSETAPQGVSYSTQPSLAEGEKTAYDVNGRRYIVGADGKVRNDFFSDQEYNANKAYAQKEKERQTLYDSMKTRLDASHAKLLDAISAKYAVIRQKQQDQNSQVLAYKTDKGFGDNTARYMSDQNNDVLQNEMDQGNKRLQDIDAQELELTAKIEAANNTEDFNLLNKSMETYDKLNDEKQKTIQEVYKNAVAYDKKLDDKAKALDTQTKNTFAIATKTIQSAAPAIAKDMAGLDEADQSAYIDALAKKLGVDRSVVDGELTRQGLKDKSLDLTVKNKQKTLDKVVAPKGSPTNAVAGAISEFSQGFEGKDASGKPIKGADGYTSPEAWSYARQQWAKQGLKDADYIKNFKRYLNPASYYKLGIK